MEHVTAQAVFGSLAATGVPAESPHEHASIALTSRNSFGVAAVQSSGFAQPHSASRHARKGILRMKRRNKLALVAGIGAIALSLAACSSGGSTTTTHQHCTRHDDGGRRGRLQRRYRNAHPLARAVDQRR